MDKRKAAASSVCRKFADFAHFRGARGKDERAGLRDDRHQTFHAQLRKRLANRRLANPERRGQLTFGKRRTERQRAFDNRSSNFLQCNFRQSCRALDQRDHLLSLPLAHRPQQYGKSNFFLSIVVI
jgi:hypothetical protein